MLKAALIVAYPSIFPSTQSFGLLCFELAPICLHLPGTELSKSTTGFPVTEVALPGGLRILCSTKLESTAANGLQFPKKPFLAGPEQAHLVF